MTSSVASSWSYHNICDTRGLKISTVIATNHLPICVIDINDIDSLTQAVGYLKYQTQGPVFFRGQHSIYNPLIPSPSSQRPNTCGISGRAPNDTEATTFIYDTIKLAAKWPDDINWSSETLLYADKPSGTNNLLNGDVPLYAMEPLLQHYGLNTRWLDLTDSLPYALFFGLVRYSSKPFIPQWKYDEGTVQDGATSGDLTYRRESCFSRVVKNVITMIPTRRKMPKYYPYLYLYAITPGNTVAARVNSTRDGMTPLPGLSLCEGGYVIDMRQAVPSYYLRPHMQHGLLWKPLPYLLRDTFWQGHRNVRFRIFRIPTETVLRWLGNGDMFAIDGIYPPLRHAITTPDRKSTQEKDVDYGFQQWERNLYQLKYDPTFVYEASLHKPEQAMKRFSHLQNYITSETYFRELMR